MFGQPHLAAAIAAELATQQEIVAPRHGLASSEFEPAGQAPAHGDAFDRAVQAIADTGLGQQALGIGLAERTAQLVDRVGQHLVDGDAASPDLAQQFFLGHHLARVAQQVGEHFERAPLDLDRQTRDAQLEARLVEFGRAEAIAVGVALG